MRKMTEDNQRDEVVQDWKNFADICPRNDNAQEWCAEHPLHIPFRDILFGGNIC